jgi:hypothetical protein
MHAQFVNICNESIFNHLIEASPQDIQHPAARATL